MIQFCDMRREIVGLVAAVAAVSVACGRKTGPIVTTREIRIVGQGIGLGDDSIRMWPVGEIKSCGSVTVKYSDGKPDEPVLTCASQEEVDDIIDLKQTGLLNPVDADHRAALHKSPVLIVTVTNATKDRWRCAKMPEGIHCDGIEDPPSTEPFEERRLKIWAKNLPKTHDQTMKAIYAMCLHNVEAELKIATYNRTHPANDQQAQVTDLRKMICGGPDGPGEKGSGKPTPSFQEKFEGIRRDHGLK